MKKLKLQKEIKRLRFAFNTSFNQSEELIKRNKKLSDDFTQYRIDNPSYISDGMCDSCGTSVRNCIC